MADTTQDRVLVGTLGQLGQVLTDFDSRHVGFDRIEQAPVLGRRFRLQIEGVHVRGTTGQVDEDRRLGSPFPDRPGLDQLQVAGEPQSGTTNGADFQEISPLHPVTRPVDCHFLTLPTSRSVVKSSLSRIVCKVRQAISD